jgi:hypothetical protein
VDTVERSVIISNLENSPTNARNTGTIFLAVNLAVIGVVILAVFVFSYKFAFTIEYPIIRLT